MPSVLCKPIDQTMPITIKTVESRKDLRAFVKFPLKLYKDCPHYVPSLFVDEMSSLDMSKKEIHILEQKKIRIESELPCPAPPQHLLRLSGAIWSHRVSWARQPHRKCCRVSGAHSAWTHGACFFPEVLPPSCPALWAPKPACARSGSLLSTLCPGAC